VTFQNKYDERTERMSIRVPLKLKNFIWQRARKQRISATDVVVEILAAAFSGQPPAPKWRPGTTKVKGGSTNDKEDVFA
jgi:hypothetical protein